MKIEGGGSDEKNRVGVWERRGRNGERKERERKRIFFYAVPLYPRSAKHTIFFKSYMAL